MSTLQFKTPNRWTIQLEADKHLEFHGGLEFVNHSCAPNTKILVSETAEEIAFVATRDIEEGTDLVFSTAVQNVTRLTWRLLRFSRRAPVVRLHDK